MKFLIVGLGNVGDEYSHTRHNIGFDVVNAFINKHDQLFSKGKLAFVSQFKWKGKTFVCICPTTYMNLSGNAVKYWMDKENIPVENILVVVDEVALPLSKIRLRPGGSSGGHNGLKSIEAMIGTTRYPRIRFGIGSDFPRGRQSDFVLSKWRTDEEPLVQKKIKRCIEVIESFATVGLSLTMNEVNNEEFSL